MSNEIGRTFIDLDRVTAGDIVLLKTTSKKGKVISIASGSYSHAAILLNEFVMFEATLLGIGKTFLTPIYVEKLEQNKTRALWEISRFKKILLLRHIDIATKKQIVRQEQLEAAISEYVGLEYPETHKLLQASRFPRIVKHAGNRVGARFPKKTAPGPFCSELVIEVFQKIGLPISVESVPASQVAPSDLANCSQLTVVDNTIAKNVDPFKFDALFSAQWNHYIRKHGASPGLELLTNKRKKLVGLTTSHANMKAIGSEIDVTINRLDTAITNRKTLAASGMPKSQQELSEIALIAKHHAKVTKMAMSFIIHQKNPEIQQEISTWCDYTIRMLLMIDSALSQLQNG